MHWLISVFFNLQFQVQRSLYTKKTLYFKFELNISLHAWQFLHSVSPILFPFDFPSLVLTRSTLEIKGHIWNYWSRFKTIVIAWKQWNIVCFLNFVMFHLRPACFNGLYGTQGAGNLHGIDWACQKIKDFSPVKRVHVHLTFSWSVAKKFIPSFYLE